MEGTANEHLYTRELLNGNGSPCSVTIRYIRISTQVLLQFIQTQLGILSSDGEAALRKRPVPWTVVGLKPKRQTKAVQAEVKESIVE
jgi:hypothetical protein